MMLPLLLPGLAGAAPSGRDSRRLTAAEAATFLPLVCERPRKDDDPNVHFFKCATLIGRHADALGLHESIGLNAVLYGSFTRDAADEAYVTYYWGDTESWGGGLLFARVDGRFKLERWVQAWPWFGCTKIPKTAPQRSLCLWGHGNEGESHQAVYDFQVPPREARSPDYPTVLVAGHGRDREGFGCYAGVPHDRATLVSIDSIRSSNAAPYFAIAKVEYETGEDIADACNGAHRHNVRVSIGEVRFRMLGGKVTAVTPVQVAP